MEGNAVQIFRTLLQQKINKNLNNSRTRAKTWNFLSKKDKKGRNPIKAKIDEYTSLLEYEEKFLETLPEKLSKSLENEKNAVDFEDSDAR